MNSNGWSQVPLSEIVEPVQRTVAVEPGKSFRTLGVKWWGEGAYERQTIDGSQTAATTLNEVRENDLIINKIWVRHGSVAVVPPEVAGCCGSNEFPTFEFQRERILPRWMHWYSKARDLWVKCDALSQGTSGKNRIRPEKFLTITIPLPPLEEQQRIVARIDSLAAKIDEAQSLRSHTAGAREAINASATSMLFEQLAVEEVPIGKLGVDGSNPVQTGPFGAQLHKSEFTECGTPVLNVGNVWPTGLRLDRLDHVSPEKSNQLARYRLRPGDILFARSGATLGKVCIVPDECDGWLMTGHLFRVRLDHDRCDPSFAFAALRGARTVRNQVFDQVRGATRPGFNTTLLSRVTLPLPPLEDQRRLVAHLNGIQSKIHASHHLRQKTAAELNAMLPSILDRAFRGEL